MGDRSHAIALFNQGVEAAKNNSYPNALQHAYRCFASACYADPTWWNAFYQAGNNNVDQKLKVSAIACYRRALQCESSPEEQAKVMSNLAWQLEEAGEIDEAMFLGHTAIDLDPAASHAHVNLSLCYRDIGDSRHMVEYAEKGFALEPENVSFEIALAFAYLFDRQMAKGLKHFDKRFQWRLQHFLNYPYPQWDGASDRTVLLIADQGLGDTLSYARFVRQLCSKVKYVHAMVQHELFRLFQSVFFDIKNLNIIPGLSGSFPAADAWTTFVSLPHALALNDEEIINAPQIECPVHSVPTTWKVPDRKLHVGIAWAGSPLNDIDKHRNIPLTEFFELYRVPGIQLYSLQVDARKNDLFEMGGLPLITDLSPYIQDVVGTVALLQHLDLVISVESALGHICAMAGKECWIPYSYLGRDYRIGLTGKDMIWTPKHCIFRQDQTRQWRPVFQEIVTALNERLEASSNGSA